MKYFVVLIAIGSALCGCLTAPTPPPKPSVVISPQFNAKSFQRIAVVVQNRSRLNLGQGTLAEIENTFTKSCIAKGYILAARTEIKESLNEIALQHSGLTEEALARKAQILAVDAILLVAIDDISARNSSPIIRTEDSYDYWRVSLSAKLLSAEKAQVLILADHSTEEYLVNGNGLERLISRLARLVADGIPGTIANQNTTSF